ncbi:MAG TPA: DUF2652 domain-containing protein [Pyrinomonadaceae bacterium]|nr:DUF2652 domain-containing protein [Pyrinomonadaceae bacterium]
MIVQPTFLLIADIAGYTRFMKFHRMSLAHAQDIVARLLEAVIDATRSRLKLAKLEGDAAFFYLTYPEGAEPDLAFATGQVATIHRAFHQRLSSLAANNLCNCDGCEQAGNLKIKFVAHLGDVAVQKVKRLTELAGVDVILVHRMLKNDVPVTEYLLMTEPVLSRLDDSTRSLAAPLQMELEGLGQADAFFVDLEQYAGDVPAQPPGSFPVRFWLTMKIGVRSIPFVIGLRKPLTGFRNIDAS